QCRARGRGGLVAAGEQLASPDRSGAASLRVLQDESLIAQDSLVKLAGTFEALTNHQGTQVVGTVECQRLSGDNAGAVTLLGGEQRRGVLGKQGRVAGFAGNA